MKPQLPLVSNQRLFSPEKPKQRLVVRFLQSSLLLRTTLLLLFSTTLHSFLFAQDVLVGLTSKGGVSGGGTAFSLKTTGADFKVHRAFVNIGTNPNGNLIKGFDGAFYGMTSHSENGYGTIFKMSLNGTLTVLKTFDHNLSGGYPNGSLVQGKDSAFYGTTSSGGSLGGGTIFKITAAGKFTVLKNLGGAIGEEPNGSLVQAADGAFYGMTTFGGANGDGTIFKITSDGTFTLLKSLSEATTGSMPYGNLVQTSDGSFYGMTYVGGSAGYGTVFKLTLPGTVTIVKNLDNTNTGGYPYGSLTKGSDGAYYGLTSDGGINRSGTIFRINTDGTFSVLKHLDETNTGTTPVNSLVAGSNGTFYGTTTGGGTYGFGTVFKFTAPSTVNVLRHLNHTTDGSVPNGSLFRDSDGSLYGTTYRGGGSVENGGTIFKITSGGSFSVLVRLADAGKGMTPMENLVQATDGFFYGTTMEGGTAGLGAVYKLCTNGTYTVLRSLTPANGAYPKGSLVQGRDGNFYGTTYNEGSNALGTIFKMTQAGVITVLKNLDLASGSYPEGSLVQGIGTDTAFYGMTSRGGSNGNGTIFKITSKGGFTVLKHLEDATTGGFPRGSLVHGTDGALYGMTSQGGTADGGTVFRISTDGSFSVIKNLSNTTGRNPEGSLIRGLDGFFYGMAGTGGSLQYGTIFKVNATGTTFTVLKNLDGITTGGNPQGNLVQGSDGTLYGMTSEGGTFNSGTIFKFNLATNTYSVLRHLNPTLDGGTPYGGLVIQKPAPVVNPQSVTTNEDVSKPITVTTAGGTLLTYTVSTAPKNGTVSGSGPTFTYLPKANFYGKDSFYVTATWGCQNSTPAKINVTVLPVNDAPVLAAITNKTVAAGSTVSFTATATDVDAGQTKTFSLVAPPAGATINATSGAFTWTPTVGGTYIIKARVTDNGSPVLFNEKSFTVTVSSTALNTSIQQSNKVFIQESSVLSITAFPNPSTQHFNLVLKSNDGRTLDVRIFNMSGQVVEERHNLSPVGSFEVGHRLKPGAYIAVLQQGNEKVQVKLVKQ